MMNGLDTTVVEVQLHNKSCGQKDYYRNHKQGRNNINHLHEKGNHNSHERQQSNRWKPHRVSATEIIAESAELRLDVREQNILVFQPEQLERSRHHLAVATLHYFNFIKHARHEFRKY